MEKRLRSIVHNKKGNLLTENVVFIILNLIFLSVLILFITSRTGNPALIEEKYSKQIALMIDSAKPGTEIHLNMEDAFEEARENDFPLDKIVDLENNKVSIKLRENAEGHSYHFFNNASVSVYPDSSQDPIKDYVILVKENQDE